MSMKWKIGVVLLAALAIEAVNFRFGGLALDPGNFSDMPWYLQLVAIEWGLLHAVGFNNPMVIDWFFHRGASGSPGTLAVHTPGSLPPVNLSPHLGTAAVLFIGGYFATAVMLFAITSSVQRFCRRKRNRSTEEIEYQALKDF